MIEEVGVPYMASVAVVSVDSEQVVLEPQSGNVAVKVVIGLPYAAGSWAGEPGAVEPSEAVVSAVDFDIEEQNPEAHLLQNLH